MPRMYIISGCNGSGKTTASYALLPELLGCREFVNSDEFAKSLSPFDPSAASVSASRYMLQKIMYLLKRDQDFCVETTLATRSLLKIINQAKSQGYQVSLIYFWLNSPELAIKRVQQRVAAGGHNISEEVIRRRYIMGLKYFFETYSPICDRWILADNSKSPFTIVAQGSADMTFIRDNEKYQTILSMAMVKKENQDV
ncbi:MAG: zeta toxin family protein [Bacteroidales bacterium]|nr:zeta toxin family protein [Bacteroidales bacterium]